jgi:dipeptidase E
MPGTIYLGGGGSPEDEHLLWKEMFKETPRVLYWPFALSGSMLLGAEGWLRENLAARWPGAALTTWTGLGGHVPSELSGFDLLFIGGGNTFDLLKHVQEHHFATPVKQFVADGGSLYGGSAGAILASDSIDSALGYDQNDAGLTDLIGLGLVPRVVILPHYTEKEQHKALKLHRTHSRPVLGIPEDSGLLVTERDATVVGRDPVYVIEGAGIRHVAPGSQVSGVALAV